MQYYVPEIMLNYNNWVVWKKIDNRKIPYNPLTRRFADPTKPCCSYDDAFSYYEWIDLYDGVGFVFTPDCGLTFIDLDDCIMEDGEFSPFAAEIIEMFSDSYIEYSQSERGIHIICKGTVPTAIKKEDIEIYSTKRYIAFTGNSYKANEPSESQDMLDILYARFHSSSNAEAQAINEPSAEAQAINEPSLLTPSLSVEQLYNVISHSKQGAKWLRLYEADITGYKSPSEAVMAFVAITNYFSSSDSNLIKDIFYLSKLPVTFTKYKNSYYVELAIKKAQTSLHTSNSSCQVRSDEERFQLRKQFVKDFNTKKKRRF